MNSGHSPAHAAISCILINPERADDVVPRVGLALRSGDEFLDDLYKEIVKDYHNGTIGDAILYGDRLSGRHSNALIRISEITRIAHVSTDAKQYAIEHVDSRSRESLKEHLHIVQDMTESKEHRLQDILAILEREVDALSFEGEQTAVELKDILDDTVKDIEYLASLGGQPVGVSTGFPRLDQYTSGLQGGDMIVLAGRPSVGKTAFALALATNICLRDGNPCAFFSLEMGREQLAKRLLSQYAEADMSKIRCGFLDDREVKLIKRAAVDLRGDGFHIDDRPSLTMLEIRSRARRLVRQGAKVIFIDYLQLIEMAKAESIRVGVTQVSKAVKALARELNVPVVVLSQLSRAAEEAGDPQMQHLKESSAIEQDADMIWLLSRQGDHEAGTPYGVCLNIAKQRNGPCGRLDFTFNPRTQAFTENKL